MPTATALAPVKRSKTMANTLAYGTNLVTFLLTAEDTGGDFSMLELTAKPGSEPPYHIHEREDETFYLMEGHVTVMVDGEIHEAFPGDAVFLPRGIPHTFRIRSESARIILTVTPSGFEEFFRSMGHPIDSFRIPEAAELPADHIESLARESARRGVRLADVQPVF